MDIEDKFLIKLLYYRKNTNRMLYWAEFKMDSGEKSTLILAAVSYEYFEDTYQKKMNDENIFYWLDIVKEKWKSNYKDLGDEVFDYPIHYDIYSNTKDADARIMDFLANMTCDN